MTELMTLLFVFAVSFVVGYILISRIPPLLHTPLMSMTNAISAVTILGAVLIFSVELGFYQKVLGVTAIIMATFNVVGGFVITDRMLKLFKKKVHTK
jgi:H+-translocating NAD(P) transhydrogenase subunit alpha